MFIPSSQINLLKSIIETFELNPNIEDRILGQIYNYLFSSDNTPLSFSDPILVDTILTLKDIVEMEGLTKLEDIITFF